jgi:hypothetical protein
VAVLGLQELIEYSRAKRNPERITVIGCYLKRNKDQNEFNRKEVADGFKEMAEVTPKNLARDLKWAMKIGWVAKTEGVRGSYYVTNKGEKAVEERFGGNLRSKTSFGRPKKETGDLT